MKTIRAIFILAFLFIFHANLHGQVTNLTVNGSSTNFTMTSGDQIDWTYNVPAGVTTLIQIWYDVNGNGTIDDGDVIYQSIEQTDGDTQGSNGPPDMNSTAGTVSISQPVGLAPGKYILKFTQNSQSVLVTGTVNKLASPAHTISGTVTPISGKSAANIFVEVKRDNYSPNFWDAVTDANGNYSIEMTSDTAGNPWRVALLYNPFPPNIVTPEEDSVTISGNLSGINFSFITVAAQVTGIVLDESGNAALNTYVSLYNTNSSNSTQILYTTSLDVNGAFQLGLLAGQLNSGYTWMLQATTNNYSDTTKDLLTPIAEIPSISSSDSIYKKLVFYSVNSYISGKVTIDGSAPGFTIKLAAANQDSAQSTVYANSEGYFTFRVTDKIYNYSISPNIGYYSASGFYYNNLIAHPGETGLIFNISTTPLSVKQVSPNIPKKYSLNQNYPNPFNPATVINYDLPKSGQVTLKVYDILGKEVSTLYNGVQNAGTYTVSFDASKLASGIYFYELRAGNFVATKKMLLLK
ncbi:MAG: T9SS type A sorting domain-containing protein [Ignavibacteriaceae bacterium]|nr:T9SS type A sorting domain-containing protein [Ignavibacteriaceae bacterium]